MVCPICGKDAQAVGGRCVSCNARLGAAPGDAGTILMESRDSSASTFAPAATTSGGDPAPNAGSTGTDPTITPVDTTGLIITAAGASHTRQKEGPLRTGQSFGSRYHIIRVLGIGGMGAVYQAWDAELSVAVALKVIRIDGRGGRVSSEQERRFKNELLLARQVTHKNVVRIHDLGEIDGIKYITMPYVQGDDLATILRRDGKLPLARALRFARQLASGLQAAHEAGVVHRDLKPANILVGGDDQALITDFGISTSAGGTATGGLVGTLEYMAPEQAKGEAIDARADIYAFGLIVYEMLTGPRIVPSGAVQDRVDAMKRRVEQGPPPLRSVGESVPPAVDALVTRCLERDPAARFQTSSELAAALGRLDDEGDPIPEP